MLAVLDPTNSYMSHRCLPFMGSSLADFWTYLSPLDDSSRSVSTFREEGQENTCEGWARVTPVAFVVSEDEPEKYAHHIMGKRSKGFRVVISS